MNESHVQATRQATFKFPSFIFSLPHLLSQSFNVSHTTAIYRLLGKHHTYHNQAAMASQPTGSRIDPWDPWRGGPYERHEMLHYLRGREEYEHRQHIWGDSAQNTYHCYEFLAPEPDQLHQMSISEVEDFCNKSAPVYLYFRRPFDPCKLSLLRTAIHNYTYRRWFRPYQSEIEFKRFLTKTVTVNSEHLRKNTNSVIDHVLSIHNAICEQVKSAQDRARNGEQVKTTFRTGYVQRVSPSEPESIRGPGYPIHNPELFILQPLFQAVAIIVLGEDYDHTNRDSEQIPVLIVLTGVTTGLSAPITFEPIVHKVMSFIQDNAVQTTLGTAITFLLDLETREIASFGLRPNPTIHAKDWATISMKSSNILRLASSLGWEVEPLTGPSSTWVARGLYPQWSGQGAEVDADLMPGHEARWRRMYERRLEI